MTGSSVLAWMKVLGVLVVIAFVAWIVYKMKEPVTAALEFAEDLNPFNYNNVFKSSVDDVVTAATGRSETLGGWLYSVTHRDPVEEIMQDKLEENPFPEYESGDYYGAMP